MSKYDKYEAARGTPKSYTIGFIASLILTMSAYLLVTHKSFSKTAIISSIVVLAVAQLVVQLVFFLHLGRESKPRWNLTVFTFMLGVLFILVFGSLWIMNNLNYHHDHPAADDTFIIKDEGFKQ